MPEFNPSEGIVTETADLENMDSNLSPNSTTPPSQDKILPHEGEIAGDGYGLPPTPPPERSLEVQFLDGALKKADLEEVTKLDLDGYQLTELPKNLKNLTQLKVLALSKNQLTELPKGLEKFTQLTYLNLNNNKLTDVKGLEKLTQLEKL